MLKFEILQVVTRLTSDNRPAFGYFLVKKPTGECLHLDLFAEDICLGLFADAVPKGSVSTEVYLDWAKAQIGKILEVEDIYPASFLTEGKIRISENTK